VPPEDVVALSKAILLVFRNQGLRANRQKSRLMYLVDKLGIEKFREEVEKQFG
jgi:ferredoxin-nitrite reductase